MTALANSVSNDKETDKDTILEHCLSCLVRLMNIEMKEGISFDFKDYLPPKFDRVAGFPISSSKDNLTDMLTNNVTDDNMDFLTRMLSEQTEYGSRVIAYDRVFQFVHVIRAIMDTSLKLASDISERFRMDRMSQQERLIENRIFEEILDHWKHQDNAKNAFLIPLEWQMKMLIPEYTDRELLQILDE